MPRGNKPKVKKTKKINQTIQNLNQKKDRKLILTEIPETEEYEIKEKATLTEPEKKMRFPKEKVKKCYPRRCPELFTPNMCGAVKPTADVPTANCTARIITILSALADGLKSVI